MEFTDPQRRIIDSPVDKTLYLTGAAGTGKTTAAVQRVLRLRQIDIPAEQILVIVPQAVLAQPYHKALRAANLPPGGQIEVLTYGGLVLNTVRLFWALAAKRAGLQPDQPPTFLTLETAQYVMASIVDPMIEARGAFEGVTIDRNRLYSQIIDNLEKAALNGFAYTDIAERLKSAWVGETSQARMFDDVQRAASAYRDHCRAHNLIDFSLQVELFNRRLWSQKPVRDYWAARTAHLIVDNAEESAFIVHELIADLLKTCESALIIVDEESGFRRFLSAAPEHAETLRARCDQAVEFTESFVTPPVLTALGDDFARALGDFAPEPTISSRAGVDWAIRRFYPQMLNWVADEITLLVKEFGVPPGQIAVLSPYLSDALRFTLMTRLQSEGIPVRSHRPSRALREEPAARCLITLAMLAHPEWGMTPTPYDVAYMFMGAVGSAGVGKTMDLIRAQLLATTAYPDPTTKSRLMPFDALKPDIQERITYLLAPRYEELRRWLEAYIADRPVPPPSVGTEFMPSPVENPKPKARGRKKKTETTETPPIASVRLDHFFSRIFGEVLSQRGYGFHNDFDAAAVAGNLIDSAANFRRAFEDRGLLERPAAHEYVRMVERGVIADQYVRAWTLPDGGDGAVLIAPAYTFLMRNQPVDIQFWLDLGNRGWFERLYQPLTHPYVLSADWEVGQLWTDDEEYEKRRDTLFRLVMGLIRRARRKIYVGVSELGENGAESQSELLQAFNRLLRKYNEERE